MGPLLDAASGLRGLVVGWVLPTLLWLSVALAFLTLALPDADLSRVVLAASWTERTVWLAGIAITASVLLSSIQTPLYRLLEGYTLPERLRDRLIERHRARRQTLKQRYDSSTVPAERNALLDQLLQYPVNDGDYLPTRFGNIIKTAETYGWDRYRLDLVGLWYQIIASVGSDLREDTAKARTVVDFQVCCLYLSAAAGLSLAVTFVVVGRPWFEILLIGAVTVGLFTVFYLAALAAAKEWGKSLVAVTDFCRVPLAKNLNLRLPPQLEDERELWRSVGQLVKYPYKPARSQSLALASAAAPIDAEPQPRKRSHLQRIARLLRLQ